MTTLAGTKIRRHRYAHTPRITRAVFGRTFGGVAATTVQGWEDEGKRPAAASVVTAIAAAGIASFGDWYVCSTCPRCERAADHEGVATCTQRHCPLASQSAA